MSNNTIQQMVQTRLTDSGALAPTSLHPVSIRLSGEDISQLDILAKYLGYGNRSQLLRDLIETSLEDLIVATTNALKDDVTVSTQFRSELHQALVS